MVDTAPLPHHLVGSLCQLPFDHLLFHPLLWHSLDPIVFFPSFFYIEGDYVWKGGRRQSNWVGVARKLLLFQNEIAAIESKRFHCHFKSYVSGTNKLMCTKQKVRGTREHAHTHTHSHIFMVISLLVKWIEIKLRWIEIKFKSNLYNAYKDQS